VDKELALGLEPAGHLFHEKLVVLHCGTRGEGRRKEKRKRKRGGGEDSEEKDRIT
jgi:hypothetical protein